MSSQKSKDYKSLIIWLTSLLAIGGTIGSMLKIELSSWYLKLNQSPLTPKNYVFSLVWTILYSLIAISGWIIWRQRSFSDKKSLSRIKILYITQLILNWSWSPIFFKYHSIGIALLILVVMLLIVAMLIYCAYVKIKAASLLMIPYLLWLCFAMYLNFYIWQYN